MFPTSEIYGGLVSSYDYGPVGTQLLRNIRNLWWQEFIEKREDMVGLDSQVILHPKTWEASGHVSNFNEPLLEDVVTHKKYRVDHLIADYLNGKWKVDKSYLPPNANKVIVEDMTEDQMMDFIRKYILLSPDGNKWSAPKKYNLLFETKIGVIEGEKASVYLRGETAQGIFSNFRNIVDSTRVRLPFGVGQIGKSFRNEITTGQFIFRTLEFEQAEIEYFFDPEKTEWTGLLEEWKTKMWQFVTKVLGVKEENLQWRQHTDKERSHYSKDTYDLDYKFPFGWKELWGIAYRTDYDLNQHSKFSGADLSYRDPDDGKVFVPHVIEPAVGINRLFFMVLSDAYFEDKNRIVLKLDPKIAPYKVAVFPLVKNKPELVKKAHEIYESYKTNGISVAWDDRGNIGKRYLSQDEIGTPWCVTVDYQTLEDDTVTIRDRNTSLQERIKVAKLVEEINKRLGVSS